MSEFSALPHGRLDNDLQSLWYGGMIPRSDGLEDNHVKSQSNAAYRNFTDDFVARTLGDCASDYESHRLQRPESNVNKN